MRQSCFSKMLLAGALLGVALPPAHSAPGPRQRLRLDANWRFHRGEMPDPSGADGLPITGWRWSNKGTGEGARMAAPDLDTSGAAWKAVASGDDVFGGRNGFAWFRATLPAFKTADPKKAPILHFESVDDNATVYLNGQKLLEHNGWDDAFDAPLGAAWKPDGPNVLAVLVENTAGGGGIAKPVTLTLTSAVAPQPARTTFSDADWRTVQVPHDYVVEGGFDPKADGSHGFRPAATAWYRKTFRIPANYRGKSLWLDFDGVFSDAKVWLNGQYLGENRSGYIGCRFDIGGAANYGGVNTLAVHCDARKFEGWWYEGGGIYRHVWLNVADPLHVAPSGTFVSSAVTGLDAGQTPAATLTIQTTLTNQAATAQPCVLVSRAQAPDGRVVATLTTRQTVPPGQSLDVRQQATIANAQLWSIETPQLYRLTTEVQRGRRVVDNCETPFGIRTIRFDADKGFFLNGKPVKIKGTCNHQDYAGVGVAMPDSLLRWRIRKLKEMGSNGYRTSHNPVAPELLDACDQQGLLVMDETRHLGDTYSGKSAPNTPATSLTDLSTMILRDRNHPSVIMWSIANEEGIQGSADGARIATAMKRRINELDGTRPVTAAMNGGHGQGMSNVLDMEGVNYSPGIYDGFHKDHPQQPLYGSETASAVTTRGIYTLEKFDRYYGDPGRGYVAAYDLNAPPWAQTTENAWRPIAERPYVAGGFVWTGFDYKGEPTPFGWPCINSHFGIMDECGFPKDNYYYYRAWWGNQPVVHLLPHWNWPGKAGQDIAVWCHGNCDRVELLLNGKSLGTKDMPRYGHLEWQVAYAPGTLEARGYNGDKVAATDRVTTTGTAAAVRLSPDQTALVADNEDVAMIPVSITDAAGRVVPTADNEVAFEVTGPGHIAGVGNGDPTSHEPDKANQRRAFNGLCMVIVQANGQPGRITVTAHAPGLKPATVMLRSTKAVVEDMK